MKQILCILLAAVLLICMVACSRQQTEQTVEHSTLQAPPSEIEGALQSFRAFTLDGGRITAEDCSEYDVTVIHFWATYCAPCIAEMPKLARFDEQKDANILFITFCIDGFENRSTAESIVEQTGLKAPVLISTDGDLYTVLKRIYFLPTTIFVDRAGNIVGNEIYGVQKDVVGSYREHIAEVLEK